MMSVGGQEGDYRCAMEVLVCLLLDNNDLRRENPRVSSAVLISSHFRKNPTMFSRERERERRGGGRYRRLV